LEPVAGLTVQPQGFGGIANRAFVFSSVIGDDPPEAEQAGGQAGFAASAGRIQPRLGKPKRCVRLPLAQQDPGTVPQRVGGQVLITDRPGNSSNTPVMIEM
jgi:hypothetical protein